MLDAKSLREANRQPPNRVAFLKLREATDSDAEDCVNVLALMLWGLGSDKLTIHDPLLRFRLEDMVGWLMMRPPRIVMSLLYQSPEEAKEDADQLFEMEPLEAAASLLERLANVALD